MRSFLKALSFQPSEDWQYRSAIRELPTQSPIFLPTDQFPRDRRLDGVKRIKRIYETELDGKYRPKLRELRQRYKGTKRCFVIGNGPSLNRTDLSVLKDEVTFAVNGFFLKARDLDWDPTFYVVEDHLVAEDRRDWINALHGPTKLFPAYLAYCLDEGDDTIFFNHRGRKSYPHGFDFSTDASEITYTGCTVTFTVLQLAFYLGFEEIYLIGVDSDYALPQDAKQSSEYGVGILDMKSDDPNHFNPDYFGKGFRWHDPQVERMLEAYEEARKVTDQTDQRIYNATVGGKLEVFPRRDFVSLFDHAKTPEELDRENAEREAAKSKEKEATAGVELAERVPRLLVLDITRCGDATATGQVKANLLSGWPEDRLLQVYNAGGRALGLSKGLEASGDEGPVGPEKIAEAIRGFQPELILYRPVPDAPHLHALAMNTIDKYRVPLVTWIMDDWPKRLERDDPAQLAELGPDLQSLFEQSAARLSICDAMSKAFGERYGVTFQAFANGVNVGDWPRPKTRPPGPFTLRYGGSLADNMTLQSVVRIAQAVEELHGEGLNMVLEIKTRPDWARLAAKHFKTLERTQFITGDLLYEDYSSWLSDADAVVIAYNFDERSIDYVRYSMANKLPECLASGAVLFAHGPREVATIDYIAQTGAAVVVDEPEIASLKSALRELAADPFRRLDLAEEAQAYVFKHHRLDRLQSELRAVLVEAAASEPREAPRELHAQVDETAVVSELLSERRGAGHFMLDVGAHHGTSANYFDQLGWRIYCCEPDAENRRKLTSRFDGNDRVTIDTRAVSNEAASGVSFFASEESTGISGLHAFRDTHQETGKVDVTTVAALLDELQIDHIDFLKIDVEGFDFNVLKGVPWDRCKPDMIEAEFEDAKTLKMGHSYTDICAFLQEQGYAVYLSEWHPIVRYGIAHDWHRVVKYPEPIATPDAWGNILAFREDPGIERVRSTFYRCMRSRIAREIQAEAKPKPRPVAQQLQSVQTEEGRPRIKTAPERRSVGERVYESVYRLRGGLSRRLAGSRGAGNSGVVGLFVEFARWLLEAIWAYRAIFAAVILAVLAVLIGAAFAPIPAPLRIWVVLSVELIVVFGLAGLAILFFARRAQAQIADLHARLNRLQSELERYRRGGDADGDQMKSVKRDAAE
ncbi:hypothetical protein A7A08_00487 [Methyloligella halotolerans]|uniref:Uncharacterized protein n=1 Tax=Methyloligella halotolerans TaxID=1177755 RepID=A0A1E2S2V2_9HYPH|nr:FkbM family methyltransferase [Methyloligella halotolerans]ODA68655.1 hypothetical protein A7A08_00487 [Methyloligella halotolerans]